MLLACLLLGGCDWFSKDPKEDDLLSKLPPPRR